MTNESPSTRENTFKSIIFSSEDEFQNLAKKAAELTSLHFGNYRELFNPIYLSNLCLNDCIYCGFRRSNKELTRRTLNPSQSFQEAKFLVSKGIKKLLILAGEYPEPDYSNMIIRNIKEILSLDVQWIGVEVAPLSTDSYRDLVNLGVKCLVMFQETYDVNKYSYLHGLSCSKSDFSYRYKTPFRALEAGINEIGLGFLYDTINHWLFDAIAMINHADEIIKFKPNVKLRFSFPRLQPYSNQDNNLFRQEITPNLLRRIIVGIRLLFPEAKLVLTARETQQFRLDNMDIVTTIGEDGNTTVGGYTVFPDPEEHEAQFKLSGRSNMEVLIKKTKELGYNFI